MSGAGAPLDETGLSSPFLRDFGGVSPILMPHSHSQPPGPETGYWDETEGEAAISFITSSPALLVEPRASLVSKFAARRIRPESRP